MCLMYASTEVYSVVVLLCLCAGQQHSAASMEAVSDDALFRDKLKLMGKCKSPDLQCYRYLVSLLSNVVNNQECFLIFSNKKEAV